MRISFIVNPVFNGWEPTDTRLGGTEEAVVNWAEEFARMGHEVIVYRNSFKPNYRHNGVMYARREVLKLSTEGVYINVKSHDIVPGPGIKMVYFTNEMNASDLDLSGYDAVVWPSEWAKKHIRVNNENVQVVPHGYDPEVIYPEKKIPKQCFYASSPDRGLDTLIEAWPNVYAKHPDATLIVTYGAPAQSLVPGVTFLGNVDEETMNDIYRTSEFWCHPANGGELFCITGLKAQAAGCVPVVIPAMALSETVLTGYMAQDAGSYAAQLEWALNGPNSDIQQELEMNRKTGRYPTYTQSARRLLQVIKSVL